MGMPLVQHSHVFVFENNIFSVLLSASSRNESLRCFVGSTLAHLLLLGLQSFFHIFLGSVKHLFFSKLVKQVSNVPSLHVAKFISSPDNPFFRVVVNCSNGEVSTFRSLGLGKANSLSGRVELSSRLVGDLLLLI